MPSGDSKMIQCISKCSFQVIEPVSEDRNNIQWPRTTTSRDDCYLTLSARRNRAVTATQLANEPFVASISSVLRFVYRKFNVARLCTRRPTACIPFIPGHRRDRLGADNIIFGP
ncbi:hypothetical protein TNCV_3597281 [Trichonephila clavipes]|nr:hypothetical protein TNCV_3597281 [Trichonephila clavipes]